MESKIFAELQDIQEVKKKHPNFNIETYIEEKIKEFSKEPFQQEYFPLWIPEIEETITLVNEKFTSSQNKSIEEFNKTKQIGNPKLNGKTISEIANSFGIHVKRGMALCPFHKDTEPSLSLSDEKGLFNCFGCGKKGNVFTFYNNLKELIKPDKKDYSSLQTEILMALNLKNKDKATELIVKQFEKENFIYSTKDDIKSEMWVYDNGIYVPHGKSFVKEFCRELLGEAFTPQLTNNVISKIEADTYIDHDDFFNTNYIEEVPLKNGILNIFTRELSPFDPKKIFFNKLPVIYNPAAECEEILNHLNTVLPTEKEVKVILELFGYLLLKEYKIEKAIMFVGHGRNGKSKTIELMKLFIGVENCSSLPLRAIHEESFSLGELFGKMANLSADLSKTDLKETGMIKSLIGRDLITAKRKYLRDLNFVNHAKMIFSANELPKIYDTTDGFWTKWVLIEFPYKFVTQKVYDIEVKEEDKARHKIMNPDIMKKLTTEEELSGLLNLALDGLEDLIKEKDFSYSKNTQQVKDLWIRQSDSFMAFCFDHLEENAEGSISKKDLRKWYHKYHKKHKVSGCSDKAIHITLENMFGASENQSDRFDRYWEGISLKNLNNL